METTGAHRTQEQELAARNLRTGLILAGLAIAFGLGFVLRVWLTS
jgi:hypothetical protein